MLTQNSLIKSSRAAFLLAAVLTGINATSHAESLIGLTNTNSVFTFDSATPTNISPANNLALFGFEGAAETAVSIDRRPIGGSPLTVLTVGQVDSDNTAIVGRLYDLDATTGFLTNARIVDASFSTSVTYTIDFNPTGPVALRIIGSDNSNYRVTNPNTGATVVDTALTGSGIPAVGVAYTNNDTDPLTGTSLYYIDRAGSRLATTAAPNGGVTTEFANALGVTLSTNGLHEIDVSGSGVTYGVFQLLGENFSRLYSLDLTTGLASATAADNRLRINNFSVTVRGIAAAPAIVPETNTMALLATGLTFAGMLIRQRTKRK